MPVLRAESYDCWSKSRPPLLESMWAGPSVHSAEGWEIPSSSAFSYLPVVHRIIAAVLEYMTQQDHLHITREDLFRISKHSPATCDNTVALPIVVLAIHTLATTRGCSSALLRWAVTENMVVPSSVKVLETGSPPLQPWEEGLPWSNSLWSLGLSPSSWARINSLL